MKLKYKQTDLVQIPFGCHLKYDVASKSKVVEDIIQNKLPYKGYALELGVTESTISYWVKRFKCYYPVYKNALSGTFMMVDIQVTGKAAIDLKAELAKLRKLAAKSINKHGTNPHCTPGCKPPKKSSFEDFTSTIVEK